ncbi:MAG: MerR family transcriptional regulator [Burkholderiaceae bacterium]|jgi:DNA-binding transcriptional MerR regulator|nr:MerR family transcriptional regulator [Burkholderiaceae bacterium]
MTTARADGTAQPALPPIPAKRYFTIGEVSDLCGVKPHVLRYWEQEFTQLRPIKRRGNRRYYQHHEVLLVRRIRELLYEQGFTISGARNRLDESSSRRAARANGHAREAMIAPLPALVDMTAVELRAALLDIRAALADAAPE